MTTIACDGKSMAADGQVQDHFDAIVQTDRRKVHRLRDGRIIGAAGNSFDADAWRAWLEGGKVGDCPIQDERFAGLVLNHDGTILWVDYKGREALTPSPCAVGSGQCYALGAMDAGANAVRAVTLAAARDLYTGGTIIVEAL